MTHGLELRPKAECDIADAKQWYDQQRPSLGTEFLDETFKSIRNVASAPLQYPVVYRETRRALLTRFPCAVYFRIKGNTVVVVAVLHTRRNPYRWHIRESAQVYEVAQLTA